MDKSLSDRKTGSICSLFAKKTENRIEILPDIERHTAMENAYKTNKKLFGRVKGEIPEVGFILYFLLLPFLYSEPYYFNQIFLSMFVLLFLLFIKLVGKQEISISLMDVVVCCFAIFGLLTILVVQNNQVDSLIYVEGITLLAAYILVRNFNEKRIRVLVYAMVASGVLQSLVGLFQMCDLFESTHHYFKVTGFFSNPGLYGGYLSVSFVAGVNLLITLSKKKHRNLWLFAALLCIGFMLIVLDSRASWLACFFCIVYIVYRTNLFAIGEIKKASKTALFVGLLGIISIIGGLYLYKKDSADVRLLIWSVCKEMIKDKPFTGHGINSFASCYMKYQGAFFKENPDSQLRNISDNNTQAFNELVKLTCEQGLFGIVIVLSLACIVLSERKGIIAASLFLTFFIFSCFSYPREFFTTFFLLPIILGITQSRILCTLKWNNKFFAIGVLLVEISVLINGIPSVKLYNKAFDGLYNETPNVILKQNIVYMSVYSKMLFDSGRYREFIECTEDKTFPFMTSIVKCDIGRAYLSQADLNKAEAAFIDAVDMVPSKILPKYLLFSLYRECGKKSAARVMAIRILASKIKTIGSIALQSRKEAAKYLANDTKK